MSSDSKGVVYAALTGNVLVAVSKFVAAFLSGSSAMLTEAVHSSTDCVNQVLLLFGARRGAKEADRSHPFGYDGEIYFYAFVVAVMVLLAGGAVSIYQGIHELRHPHPIEAPALSLTVLLLSAVFEGGSLYFGYNAAQRLIARHTSAPGRVSIWRFIGLSKDPNMYETLLEDSAALVGIGLAALGVLGSVLLGLLWMDAAASIAIGVLLIINSCGIAFATRSLIAGEAVTPALLDEIERALDRAGLARRCGDLKSLHLGPNTVLVTVRVSRGDSDGPDLAELLDDVTRQVKDVDDRIKFVYFDLATS